MFTTRFPHFQWPRFMYLVALLCMAWVAGCRDNPPVVYPTVAPQTEEDMPLGPNDKIAVIIYNGSVEKSRAEYLLDTSGDIDLPFIGTVKAAGQTIPTIKQHITARLADGYLVTPIVSVTVLEINSRRVSVSGQVQRNGTIKFTPGMTIIDAIAQSGGITPMARANAVRITRSLNGKQETYVVPYEMINEGKRPNFPLAPGDQVYVDTRVF